MENNQAKMGLELCFNEANAFLEIAIYCYGLDTKAQNSPILFKSDAFFFFPAIINLSLATELYLKALNFLFCGQYPHVHKLTELFENLPENEIENLNHCFSNKCKHPVTLLETLRIHETAFIEWRYAFEPKNHVVEAYFDNLQIAAELFRDTIEQ